MRTFGPSFVFSSRTKPLPPDRFLTMAGEGMEARAGAPDEFCEPGAFR
jgi:hypothetical protein